MKPVLNSSNIRSADYVNGIASVEFQDGAIYDSSDVSAEEWSPFEATFNRHDASTGKHYHKHLKQGKKWIKREEK
jgi:hypothetical protein